MYQPEELYRLDANLERSNQERFRQGAVVLQLSVDLACLGVSDRLYRGVLDWAERFAQRHSLDLI